MDRRVSGILAGGNQELVWLLEHPPLYSAGTSADSIELVQPDRFPVHQTGRGGKYTYHGPGQRIAYVMMDLARRDKDIHAHVWRLEEWIIRVLDVFDVKGERIKGRVGVWVNVKGEPHKISTIGVRARRWVTSHGVALNVNPDLSHFEGIVPCGLSDAPITSLAALGVRRHMSKIDEAFSSTFKDVFG
jgi:lipoyl(octanoyl) transferase